MSQKMHSYVGSVKGQIADTECLSETERDKEKAQFFSFKPNQLRIFYPKAVQRLLHRKHKLQSEVPTTSKLCQNIIAPLPGQPQRQQKKIRKVRDLTRIQENFTKLVY